MGYLFGLAGSLLGTLTVAFIFILAVMHWQFILTIVLGIVSGLTFDYWRKHVRWVKPMPPYHTDTTLKGRALEKRLLRQLAWLGYSDTRPFSRFNLNFLVDVHMMDVRQHLVGFSCCGDLRLAEMQKNAQARQKLGLDQVIIATTHPISPELRAVARQLHVTLWDQHDLAKLPLKPPSHQEQVDEEVD
ncbi:hypothetical protein [Levilactobacillus zymae]|uniref:hypothetical protein n=1 Tax=Levilactobacillus zymae TaxID=267363 RepID=UPI0028BA1D49|nr:hypothetical protein [Levilactobacillus zymae]MDT6980755.1 hypothetical protein [Levilactobacillus zymae]